MKNSFIKTVISVLLIFTAVFPSLSVFAKGAEQTVTDYLMLGDYVVISPAEGETLSMYALSSERDGYFNGDKVHMWRSGSGVKWCVRRYNDDGTFALISSNFRETQSETDPGTDSDILFWDLKDKGTAAGTKVHLWEDDDLNDDSKLFYLVEDGDGDSETFYICSYLADSEGGAKYIAPKDRKNFLKNGVETVLSDKSFLWRVEVIDRVAKGVDIAWMDDIRDDVLLSNINIPGTHDSATANVYGSFNEDFNFVACQKYFIDEQLIAGIRAFDIRCDLEGETVVLSHSSFNCYEKDHGDTVNTYKTLDGIMKLFSEFLKDNPSETVIILVKRDHGDESKMHKKMYNIIKKYTDVLYDWSSDSPTLGEVRGKIVLMSRFPIDRTASDAKYFGPDISKWDKKYSDNIDLAQNIATNSPKTGINTKVFVQDNYDCIDSYKKTHIDAVLDQLNGLKKFTGEAGSGFQYWFFGLFGHKKKATDPQFVIEEGSFIFNYLSKTTPTPFSASEVMNSYIMDNKNARKYFEGGYRTGVTVIDYADKTLAKYIIGSNKGRGILKSEESTTAGAFIGEGSKYGAAVIIGSVCFVIATSVTLIVIKRKKAKAAAPDNTPEA